MILSLREWKSVSSLYLTCPDWLGCWWQWHWNSLQLCLVWSGYLTLYHLAPLHCVPVSDQYEVSGLLCCSHPADLGISVIITNIVKTRWGCIITPVIIAIIPSIPIPTSVIWSIWWIRRIWSTATSTTIPPISLQQGWCWLYSASTTSSMVSWPGEHSSIHQRWHWWCSCSFLENRCCHYWWSIGSVSEALLLLLQLWIQISLFWLLQLPLQ